MQSGSNRTRVARALRIRLVIGHLPLVISHLTAHGKEKWQMNNPKWAFQENA
jgi:hypothetical protein